MIPDVQSWAATEYKRVCVLVRLRRFSPKFVFFLIIFCFYDLHLKNRYAPSAGYAPVRPNGGEGVAVRRQRPREGPAGEVLVTRETRRRDAVINRHNEPLIHSQD